MTADLYDAATKAGHIVTMMFGPMRPDALLPDVEGYPNRDWIPWDRTRYDAALAEGVKVTVNVQIKRA